MPDLYASESIDQQQPKTKQALTSMMPFFSIKKFEVLDYMIILCYRISTLSCRAQDQLSKLSSDLLLVSRFLEGLMKIV